jgi:hypothetical protein
VVAFFPSAQVRISGTDRCYERKGDSGHRVRFHFCPNCGSSVYWRTERRADQIGVAVGAFADPSFPPPAQEVFVEHRHAWVAALRESL